MASATITETANSMEFNVNLQKTPMKYRNSFGSFAFKHGIWSAWNIVEEASRTWSALKDQLDVLLSTKRSQIRPPKVYDGPKDPLWALRCYMIGWTQEYASPSVPI